MERSVRTGEDIPVPRMQVAQSNQKGVGVTCIQCEVYRFWSTPSFARPDTDNRPTCRGCVKLMGKE